MATVSNKTSIEAREKCWVARDLYYACLSREAESQQTSSIALTPNKPPPACAALRQDFEAMCLPSWVKHFDDQIAYKVKVQQQYPHMREQQK